MHVTFWLIANTSTFKFSPADSFAFMSRFSVILPLLVVFSIISISGSIIFKNVFSVLRRTFLCVVADPMLRQGYNVQFSLPAESAQDPASVPCISKSFFQSFCIVSASSVKHNHTFPLQTCRSVCIPLWCWVSTCPALFSPTTANLLPPWAAINFASNQCFLNAAAALNEPLQIMKLYSFVELLQILVGASLLVGPVHNASTASSTVVRILDLTGTNLSWYLITGWYV